MVAALSVAGGCRAPRIGALTGTPTVARLPVTALQPGHRRLVFRWEYRDKIFGARGEGLARIASPDSARFDFFLENGEGGGFAILLGDTLFTPGGDDARRYLPPVPMIWGALARVTVAAPDTVAFVDGDTLRAEIGRDPAWRVTFAPSGLVRMEHIVQRRLVEWLRREPDDVIRYRQTAARRELTLRVTRTEANAAFDPAIWRR